MTDGALFRVASARAALSWGAPRGAAEVARLGPADASTVAPGRFALRWRADGPSTLRLVVAESARAAAGPGAPSSPTAGAQEGAAEPFAVRLFEQTDYPVYLRALATGTRVALVHRDPVVTRDLQPEDDAAVVHGYVNFGAQVGVTEFTVLVDGAPEFSLELEVFPTKLDYARDYAAIVGDVQDVLTGLALEYLRATHQLGRAVRAEAPTRVEWLTLLRSTYDELERALHQVAQRPVRALSREPVGVRAERIKRVDPAVRAAVLRGVGRGASVALDDARGGGGVSALRERLTERRARSTLDTPEHRWLARQLHKARQGLGALRADEGARAPSERRDRTVRELERMEAGIARLLRLEPLAAAEGDAPPGFASMQLMAAPGYREAYQACTALGLGLRVEGGPVALAVKDLAVLYEYWCYLTLLRVVAEETGCAVPADELFTVRESGLHVRLQRGRESAVRFRAAGGRTVTVTYNPRFQDDRAVLVPQQPDMLVAIDDPHWPTLRLLVDAKYRVDASPEYVRRYGAPGPPEDALNALHRYRDAILEAADGGATGERPSRTVVQAVALYPYREATPGAFGATPLFRALERLGVGAVALLPGDDAYLRAWLRASLRRGAWSLADRTVAYRAQERAHAMRLAAGETVLLGVLRAGREREHLEWVRDQRTYYLPLAASYGRQQSPRWIALYSPAPLRRPGAVTHAARVESFEVARRRAIATPWPPTRDADELCAVYRLGELRPLAHPVANQRPRDDGDAAPSRGARFSGHRWTSRLALERATVLEELLLETEPEWRLYEDLRAAGVPFRLQAGAAPSGDLADPRGRVWFVTERGPRARYAGAERFLVRTGGGGGDGAEGESVFPRLEQVVAALRAAG